MRGELIHEGPLTILFAAAVGAAIGGLMLGGAWLFSSTGAAGLLGTASGGAFIGTASLASAALTTIFVGARGYLEGRHDALEKNTIVEHVAQMHGSEIALRGKELKQELTRNVAKSEGTTPEFIRSIIESGKRGSPQKHVESILAQQDHFSSADQRR
jgi:hypothetical protein